MNEDFFVLTAEPDELNPLLRHLIDITPIDGGFETANIINSRGGKFSVLLYPNGCGQGTNKASVITTQAILTYHPHMVILLGIAGGYHENGVFLGDVLVPEYIDPYEMVKKTPSAPAKRRHPLYPTSAELIGLAKSISRSPQHWHDMIRETRPNDSERQLPTIHAIDRGVLGSGEKLIADQSAEERQFLLCCHETKALGFEMEAAGVATACHQRNVSFCVVKGVQDNGTLDKDDPNSKDLWRPYAEDATASLTALIMNRFNVNKSTYAARPPTSKTSSARSQQVIVNRLRPTRPKEIAASLLGLYQVDQTFPPEDRYNLKLLQLALRQPDAFWVARVGHQYVGYLSIFRMTSNNLYASLTAQAYQGTLDLPDFGGKLLQSIDPRRLSKVPKSEKIHLYIDALVVREVGRNVSGNLTAYLLIDRAKSDLAEIMYRTDSIATISTNNRIEKLITQKWPQLIAMANPDQNTKRGVLYRHLFHWERASDI